MENPDDLRQHWSSGWWLTNPSEKWWSSSVGMMKFPTEWKVIKFHGSKPPTRHQLRSPSHFQINFLTPQLQTVPARRLSHCHQSQVSIYLLLFRSEADGQTITLQRSLRDFEWEIHWKILSGNDFIERFKNIFEHEGRKSWTIPCA